ncbi:MAG: phage tail tape measure protein, partial [Pseudomonadota bacterium]
MAGDTQEFRIRIKVGTEGVREVDLLDNKMGRLEGSTTRSGGAISRWRDKLHSLPPALRTTIAALTLLLGVMAGGVAAVTSGAQAYVQYERSMANVASVAGANAEGLKRLSQAAREQAATSVFSARESANAQYYLASAGMSVNQVISAQRGVMDLAAATQADLASTSETVASTLSQFEMRAEDSARVANVFAAAISGSQANMEKLSASMRYVGPIANTLGQSLELTTAQLMALYDGGLQGMQAGTGLRMAMLRLQKPTDEASKALASLGVNIYDSTGKVRPLLDVLSDLKAANMQAGDAAEIFGTETASAVMILTNAVDKVRRYEQAVTGTNKASEMATQQMDTLWGDLKKMASAAEESAIQFMDYLAPGIRLVVQGLTWMVGNLGTVTGLVLAGAAAWYGYQLAVGAAAVGMTTFKASLLGTLATIAPWAALVGGTAAVITGLVVAMKALGVGAETTAERLQRLADAHETARAEAEKSRAAYNTTAKALTEFEKRIESANGNQTAEYQAVLSLNSVYPALVEAYKNADISLDKLVITLREYLALKKQESELQRTSELEKTSARIQAANEAAAGSVGELKNRLDDIRAAYMRYASATGDYSKIVSESKAAVNAQVDVLRTQYAELTKLKTQYPELSGSIETAQAAIVAALQKMAQEFNHLSDKPANALRLILSLMQNIKKETQAVKPFDISQLIKPLSDEDKKALNIAETVIAETKKAQAQVAVFNAKMQGDFQKAAAANTTYELAQLDERFVMYQALYGDKIPKVVLDAWRAAMASKIQMESASAQRSLEIAKETANFITKLYIGGDPYEDFLRQREALERKQLADAKALVDKLKVLARTEKEQKVAELKAWYEGHLNTLRAAYGDSEEFYQAKEALDAAYTQKSLRELKKYATDTSGIIAQVFTAWADVNKNIGESTKNMLQSVQQMMTNTIAGIIKGDINSLDDVWESVLDNMINIFANFVAQIVTIWATSNIASLFGFGTGTSFGNLFGGSQNPVSGVAGSVANSAIGAGLWAGAKALGAKAAAALGMDSVAAWLGGAGVEAATEAGVQAASQAAAQVAMETGLSMGGEFAMTTAAQEAALQFGGTFAGGEFAGTGGLYSAAAEYGAAAGGEFAGATGTGSSGAMTGSMAAFLASPAGAMALGVLPGMIGMVFGKQIDSLFGWDGRLTPEEAMSNWEGQSAFIENIAKQLDGLAPTVSGINQEFGMFSEAAQDAALKFEQLETVAGLTKEQLDAVKASLSPTAQAFLDSGIKARNLNNEVSRLTQEMNAAINSYTMTSDAVNEYNRRIDD